ncbi:MAG TPA: SRPBCC domain-containing protein [Chloroflexota bacterium]|jgi:uncharacterized protein YndB with AHSA1/START domain
MTDADTDLTVVRSFDAPREAVWSAWTSPEQLTRWWWPERFQTTYEVDLRVGGAYRFRTIEVPGIGVLNLTGRFETVQPSELLVYTWHWDSGDERESRVTVEFLDREKHTELRVHHVGFSTPEERDNHVTGWNDCLDRLEAFSGVFEPTTRS